jgi:aldehyde:ferredoxin oxidoreductase
LARELQEESVNAALIGPAGENLSYMASIINEGHRAAARGGSGAVMGSKKLKGIVARGKQRVSLFNEGTVRSINKKMMQNIKGAPIGQMYSRHGTGGFTVAHILGGDGNVKNWSGTGFEDFPEELSEKISTQTMDPLFMTAAYGTPRGICEPFASVSISIRM